MANTGSDRSHAATHGKHVLEEWISIITSAVLSLGAIWFFFKMPNWTPAGTFFHYMLAWLVLGYLAIQLVVLLSTAIDSRSIGFLDSLMSLAPVVIGAIIGVNALQGIVKLSTFQEHALLLMIGTCLLEALITLWVRFTVNQRTIGLNPGG
jgi:hypothetical protein